MKRSLGDHECESGRAVRPGSVPRTAVELRQSRYTAERFLRLKGTKVLWMNGALLRADFPSLSSFDDATLRQWLLENAGLISKNQSVANPVNMSLDGALVGPFAIRPPRYGRSAILEVTDAERGTQLGLLDIKGVGVANGETPKPVRDRDGLLSVSAAVVELFFEKLIRNLGAHFELGLATVDTYALIWLGFYGTSGVEGSFNLPACQLIRRAHVRPIGNIDLPAFDRLALVRYLAVELCLRQFGITSTSSSSVFDFAVYSDGVDIRHGGARIMKIPRSYLGKLIDEKLPDEGLIIIDAANIQMCRGQEDDKFVILYDFGQYSFQERFSNALVQLADDCAFNWGIYLRPEEITAYQPHNNNLATRLAERRSLDREIVGHFGFETTAFPMPRHLGFEIAHGFEKYGWTADDVSAAVDDAVDKHLVEIDNGWRKARPMTLQEIREQLSNVVLGSRASDGHTWTC